MKYKISIDKNAPVFTTYQSLFKFLSYSIRAIFTGYDVYKSRPELDEIDENTAYLYSLLCGIIVCFSFGLLNGLFLLAFSTVCFYQFAVEFRAGLFFASLAIITGFLTLLLAIYDRNQFILLIPYPVTAIISLVLYLRGKEPDARIVVSEIGKILLFAGSKVIPYLLLRAA